MVQQHYLYYVVEAIDESLFGSFIKIHDQERNRQGALIGSRTGRLDTLDMSRASDTVSVDLVRRIFPRTWAHALLSTRTSIVETPKGDRKVVKFAPMGSALCFPVQSIIFTAVTIYAYMLHYAAQDINGGLLDISSWTAAEISGFIKKHIPRDFAEAMLGSYDSLGVYGDDIICDSRTTMYVMATLQELGFEPNRLKSFYGDLALRESCGIYAVCGEVVTPYKFRMKHFDGPVSTQAFASLVEQINLAGDFGYGHLHGLLLNFALRWKPPKGSNKNPVLFTNDRDTAFAIYTCNPHNSHLRRIKFQPEDHAHDIRFRYHKDVVRCWVLRPEERIAKELRELAAEGDTIARDQLSAWDKYELHLWYRSTILRGEEYYCTPREVNRNTEFRWRWVAA